MLMIIIILILLLTKYYVVKVLLLLLLSASRYLYYDMHLFKTVAQLVLDSASISPSPTFGR